MEKSNLQEKFHCFRHEFPYFVYEGYDFSYSEHGLDIRFDFNLAGRYTFHPTLFIPHKDLFLPSSHILGILPNIVFQIGLIELISYWKAACPPQVIIKPHMLTDTQIHWWKKVWFNGLGEFFYRNRITTTPEDFMQLHIDGVHLSPPVSRDLIPDTIVPVGGGKDSVVTLEVLRKNQRITPMIVNPRGASVHGIFTAGFAHAGMIGIHRTIDPQLISLNGQGFLNGHTPFSALLAFLSVLAALMSGKKYIALSNESSANEPTIAGTEINHQYSKTYAFERDFREYVAEFVCPDLSYFSFLRPLNEIQISSFFSRYPAFFGVFKSCNAGSKSDSWCGVCPKCLFTAIMLAPFIHRDQLRTIFHKDMFDDLSLKPLLDQLTGYSPEKPFECVGTTAEVRAALDETIRTWPEEPLPALLVYYKELTFPSHQIPGSFQSFLQGWDPNHFLPPVFEKQLRNLFYG